jgi:uncharacterized protein YuzE
MSQVGNARRSSGEHSAVYAASRINQLRKSSGDAAQLRPEAEHRIFAAAGNRLDLRHALRISDSVNIDLAPDGTVYGIELLNANQQLREGDAGKLIVINEARGDRQEVPLGM